MRRKDRECNEKQFLKDVLDQAEELYLALLNEDMPYCLPVNFVHVNNSIYIHSAREGLKIRSIEADNRVAFSTAVDVKIDVDQATTYYRSICGQGHAEIVTDSTEKGHALDALARKYKAHCHIPAREQDIARVAIIRIDIDLLTGKWCKPKGN